MYLSCAVAALVPRFSSWRGRCFPLVFSTSSTGSGSTGTSFQLLARCLFFVGSLNLLYGQRQHGHLVSAHGAVRGQLFPDS